MLEKLSKLFNISCLLGFHESIVVEMSTVSKVEDSLRKRLNEVHKWDSRVVNVLPVPNNVNKKLYVTSCPHCGHVNNQIHTYVIKRTRYYVKIVDRYTRAVENYLTWHSLKQRGTT